MSVIGDIDHAGNYSGRDKACTDAREHQNPDDERARHFDQTDRGGNQPTEPATKKKNSLPAVSPING